MVSHDHPGIAWMRQNERGRAWLANLPRLVAETVEQWSLTVGEPFQNGHAALVMPARTADGTEAVLKIGFPDPDGDNAAVALECWAGNGAVRLYAQDRARRAMIVERCRPGTQLTELDNDAGMAVLIGLLPRLLVSSGPPIRALADEAAVLAESLPREWEGAGRPFERSLVDLAVDLLRTLPRSQGEPVLLHQDLHADNVLRAEREPWLVIDPVPLLGEREFQAAPIVRGGELGHSRRLVRRRLDMLTAELGWDRERARGWTIAHTLAWGFENGKVLPAHLDVVRWLAP